ncbi:MAG TPA: hypothetical protein DEG69_14155 [Flavobacteriaceae bacterium]|nr:hypothetical protein [Flavobacteriaceae bacterium]
MSKTVLVVGDSIIDHDVFCESIGLSLETPTMKTKLLRESNTFGGTANVVSNLLSLGCTVYFVTGVGSDVYAQTISDWVTPGLNLSLLRYDGESVVKSRYWIQQNDISYKYLQVNRGTRINKSPFEIYTSIKTNIDIWNPDLVLLVDYRNGLFKDRDSVKEIIEYSQNMGARVISSSQTSSHGDNYSLFHGSDLICMNHHEANYHMPEFTPTKDGMKKFSEFTSSNVCVTLGAKGCVLYDNQEFFTAPAYETEVVDTCGAGDAFLAALTSQYHRKDLTFCNKWAALTTIKRGVYVPTVEELNEFN